MSGRDEWGPWIEHDGKGCPCVGRYVHIVTDGPGRTPDGEVTDEMEYVAVGMLRSWDWSSPTRFVRVIRYRIRKPKGLTMLEQIARDVKIPVGGVPV